MRHVFATLFATAVLYSALLGQGATGPVYAQGSAFGKKPNFELHTALIAGEKADVAVLQVRIDLAEGVNTYSMSPKLPKPTKITLTLPAGWQELDKAYETDPPPEKGFDEVFGQEMEKFYHAVVFSKRIALPAGTNLQAAKLQGKIQLLICDHDSCLPQSKEFEAAYSAKSLKKEEKLGQSTSPPASHVPAISCGYVMTPKRESPKGAVSDPVSLQFELCPENAVAGDVVTLAITMTIADNWSTYGLEKANEDQIETPTTIKFKTDNLELYGPTTSVPAPELHTTKLLDEVQHANAHEHQVTWLQKFRVLETAPFGVSGVVKYQICETGSSCLPPQQVSYSLGNMQVAADVADSQPIVKSYVAAEPTEIPAFSVKSAGGDLSFVGAFLAAFFAGLLMNILPCVLPVLAIKILSLVQQAGEKRSRIIGLNLAYTAGVMAIFMGFAFLSWGLGQSLSSVFQNEIFMIVMACVVFLMGLSLFGVFELPVPGIIPSAGHHQEGYLGAFNTGVIATILGTPCLGPFIAPVFTWTLTQPTIVVFSIFGMMGLGMASPFLLTGLVPSMVNWLPRPGDWMVRFKQFTGFILMGTVIWLLVSIDMAWRVPVLVLLLALGMLVWMWANLAAPHDPFPKRLRASLAAIVTAAPIFLFGLWMMQEYRSGNVADKMPWQPFSGEQMVKLRTEGRPMLIDFTANWCVICKINEKIALDRDETVKFIEKNGFVPMLADFTKENPEILKWLREFGQESVPLTIIVPPGKGSEIIALRGQYTQTMLLEKLKQALDLPESKVTSATQQEAPALEASQL